MDALPGLMREMTAAPIRTATAMPTSVQLDFCIVGAPKCGTTSLYAYLSEHPGIYLPECKEPQYFAEDLSGFRAVTNGSDYDSLFKDAPEGTLLGEASVWYLYSQVALPRLLAANPNAKLIAMVRNPIEMAPSLHSELVWSRGEDVTDFERAWNLQEARRRQDCLPRSPAPPSVFLYKDVCSLGKQVKQLMDLVPEEQRLVIVFDDFKRDPAAVYRSVLAFLGVKDDGRQHFPRFNSNKTVASHTLHKIRRSGLYRLSAKIVGSVAPWAQTGIGGALERANTRKTSRPALPATIVNELARAFEGDIVELESLLRRDLGHWRPKPQRR